MKIPYFCCIGAELKRYAQDFDFMNQVYLYKVPTDDSIDEVLSEDYFKAISNSVLQDDIVYIYEASAETLHECRFDKQNGHITAVPLASDETLTGAVTSIIHDNLTPNKLLKSDENGKVAASDFSENDFVNIDGSSIMTAPLKFRAGSMRGAVGPYLNGVSFWKMDSQENITNIANLTDSQFLPVTTNAIDLGRSANKWKDLYLAGKAYMSVINNGYDIAVPVTNSADTLALKSEVDLAANSGDQLTEKGVWYAKMYSATVAPSAEDGTNYADFSQVDGQGNPIIVIYKRQNGAWVQDQTITPPAEYNGYVPVTSKIWDIVEQAGQQGGKVLWSHNQKTFTPSPLIISFEDIEVTGNSTVIMPANPTDNSIPSKKYIDDLIASLDVPELFDWKWKDCTTSNVRWALSDGNWKTNTNAYQHLVDDFDNISTTAVGVFKNPLTNDIYYRDTSKDATGDAHPYAYTDFFATTCTTLYADTEIPTPTTIIYEGSGSDASRAWLGGLSYSGQTLARIPQEETISGTSVYYFVAPDKHKIVLPNQESNVTAIYNATGVAWYYIIDTANQQFKLPRVNPDVVKQGYGTIPVIGTGKTLGLTDGTKSAGMYYTTSNMARTALSTDVYGANNGSAVSNAMSESGIKGIGVVTDATKSGIVADVDAQTTIFSGKKYLYFYVGN